jgi:ABC-2 type transport system ATP-binding protein
MKILTGFMAPSSGTARIAGFDVFENPIEVKKRIGYLPEIPPVYTDMYVTDYLKFVAQLKGVEKSRIHDLVKKAIKKTDLGVVQNRLIHNLSKGFRQRVGIAQALVSDPEVLILDEPTVGLDPKQVADIRNLIKELKGEHTLILSTHVLPEVQATCERIIIINQGKIVVQDSIEHLSLSSSGSRKVSLKVKRPSADILTQLSLIPGVLKVQLGAGENEWVLDTKESDEVVEAISNTVVAKGFGLLEISSAKFNLEDVFLELTNDHVAAHA